MATTKYWTGGANDGNFGNLSNWSEGTAFANDDIYVVGATNQDIVAGLTHAYTGITLIVTEGYGGNIGTGASTLSFSSVASLTYAGRGASAKFGSSGTVTTAQFDHIGGIVHIASGTWTEITNTSGRIDVAAAAVVTRMNNISGNATIGYNSTAITNLYNAGGLLTYRRNATNAYTIGGRVTQENNGTANYTLATNVYVYPNGFYNKRSSGADVTGFVFPRATYTTEGNAGGGATTVDLGNLEIWAGSKVKATGVPGVTFDITGFSYKGAALTDTP